MLEQHCFLLLGQQMDLTLEEFTNSAAQWDGKCDNQARPVAGQDRPSCPGPYTGNILSLSHPFALGKKKDICPFILRNNILKSRWKPMPNCRIEFEVIWHEL